MDPIGSHSKIQLFTAFGIKTGTSYETYIPKSAHTILRKIKDLKHRYLKFLMDNM